MESNVFSIWGKPPSPPPPKIKNMSSKSKIQIPQIFPHWKVLCSMENGKACAGLICLHYTKCRSILNINRTFFRLSRPHENAIGSNIWSSEKRPLQSDTKCVANVDNRHFDLHFFFLFVCPTCVSFVFRFWVPNKIFAYDSIAEHLQFK